MRILIAEDDPVSRRLLETTLLKAGYEITVTCDGHEAWEALQREAPAVAILDWMMPGMDGIEICRRARTIQTSTPTYLILLTAKSEKGDIVHGLDSGADDYVTKPFDRLVLQSRISVGLRIGELQRNLANRIVELETALTRVRQLQGLLPICSYCKKVRDDQNYWQQVDSYISKHSEVEFSHSICPTCFDSVMGKSLRATRREDEKNPTG